MSVNKEFSFVRDGGFYKDKSEQIKDQLYSWKIMEDNKTYILESATENAKHSQEIEPRHMRVFGYHSKSLISKDGFFYSKFSCEEFSWVEQIYDTNYYICRKSEKYGLIDGEGNRIIDIVYPLITRLPKIVDIDIDDLFWYEPPHIRKQRKEELGENAKPYIILKMTTYDGEYLLEINSMHKSKTYNKIYTFGKNYVIENNGLYGLLSPMGEEIVPPKYAKAYPFNNTLWERSIDERYRTGGWIEVEIDGEKFPIANNGKYYGEIPLEYDLCSKLDIDNWYHKGYYLVTKNNKKGVLDMGIRELSVYIPVKYKSIRLDPNQPFDCLFAIVQDKDGYKLFNTKSKKIESEAYQSLIFTFNIGLVGINAYKNRLMNYSPFFIAQKNNKFAVLSQQGIPLTDFIYQTIKPMICRVFPVCLNNKWGIIDMQGNLIVECMWDRIVKISNGYISVEKSGEVIDIKVKEAFIETTDTSYSSYERQTYERYNGTYAQDEMGYSDDEIDTIFEGDPSACWNID